MTLHSERSSPLDLPSFSDKPYFWEKAWMILLFRHFCSLVQGESTAMPFSPTIFTFFRIEIRPTAIFVKSCLLQAHIYLFYVLLLPAKLQSQQIAQKAQKVMTGIFLGQWLELPQGANSIRMNNLVREGKLLPSTNKLQIMFIFCQIFRMFSNNAVTEIGPWSCPLFA